MTFRKLYLLIICLVCQFALAQKDSINYLDVVKISDTQLKNFSSSQSVLKLNDSVIRKNQSSLTSLLNYNSVIYFKENGLGMVSSPSFRGTTAQQTAVVWNGININSQLNGQTDFNTITTRDFNSISVRAGGGSVIYGSSAIGGSIHLNNEIAFNRPFTNELSLNYGSFNTFSGNYKISVADDKTSFQASVSRNSSDNDYDYEDSQWKNLNGQYYNTSFNTVVGYKLNANNFLKLYSQFFDGERHFSLIFPSEVKTKYQDLNTRNLLEWDHFAGRFHSTVKLAALSEKYKYFGITTSDSFSYGEVKTYIAKYDVGYELGNTMKLNAIADYTQNNGNGSDIKHDKREIGSGSFLFTHSPAAQFRYELGLRKEVTDNYKSPFLYSLGANYTVSDFYRVKLNGSRNFRVPTFNDLYWQPGGNENLRPESSYQAELGNEFHYRRVTLTLTGYYIKIKDMLRWVPNGSVWSPINTNKVNTYGGEAILNWNADFGQHHFSLNATYAYTVSEDMEKQQQLVYVPYHKTTASLSYGFKKLSLGYQFLYNGAVFTRSDNDPKYTVASYLVSNASADYNFGKSNTYQLGFRVLNLWNENYASVESRFQPGRNFNLYLNLKF